MTPALVAARSAGGLLRSHEFRLQRPLSWRRRELTHAAPTPHRFRPASLIYLEVGGDGLVTTGEVAEAYGISQHHLAKVVQDLTALSYVESVRGGKGGIRLAESSERINIGAVVRHFISSTVLIECFDEETNTCPISPACRLKKILRDSEEAFLKVLDEFSLRDIARNRRRLATLWPSA